jgi:hypothetical protein
LVDSEEGEAFNWPEGICAGDPPFSPRQPRSPSWLSSLTF